MNDSEKEIIEFSTTINDLLRCIENRMLHQHQFHAYASHEIKTSMSIIRGMLEVLARRKRDTAIYEGKLKEVIKQVDSMGIVIEQALLLSWLNSNRIAISNDVVNLYCLLNILEDKWLGKLYETNLSLQIEIPHDMEITTDCYLLELVLDKLISNSIRHGRRWSNIHVCWDEASAALLIFDSRFHESLENENDINEPKWTLSDLDYVPVEIDNKLVLAIVSKAASLIGLQVRFTELEHHRSFFTVQFSGGNVLSKT